MLDFLTPPRTLIDCPLETLCMHVNVVKTVFTQSSSEYSPSRTFSMEQSYRLHLTDLPLTLDTVKNNLHSACTINPTGTDICSVCLATACKFFSLNTAHELYITADIYILYSYQMDRVLLVFLTCGDD